MSSFLTKLAGARDEDPIDVVAKNLTAVLNAKQGYTGAVEVFGMGSYERYAADKTLVEAMMAEILDQVRRHEPRLREPRITLVGRDRGLWVRFALKGRIDEQTVTYTLLLHSVLRGVEIKRESVTK